MKKNCTLFRILGLLGASLIIGNIPLQAFSFGNLFKRYEQKKPVDAIRDLEDQLVHNPKDPCINYNLGVALYKSNRFDEAKSNFQRAALHATNSAFKEQSYFNLGNCLYKNALSIMPENWESSDQDVDIKILEQAAVLASNAIKEYDSALAINEKNEKAISNRKEATKLLSKILEKKKQEQQKEEEDKKNKNKDNQDQDDKNQDQNEKDQDKKSDQENSSKDQKQNKSSGKKNGKEDPNVDDSGLKKDKDNKKQEQKDQSDDQDQSSKKDNEQQGEQGREESKPEQGREKDSSHNDDASKDNGKENPEEEEQKENDKNNTGHDEQPNNDPKDTQQSPSQGSQPEDEKQDNGTEYEEMAESADQVDGTDKRVFQAILDNLNTNESKLQKHMIMQKTKGQKPPVGNMQKPW